MNNSKKNATIFFTGLIILILIVFVSIYAYYKFTKDDNKGTNVETEIIDYQDDDIVEATVKPFEQEETIILNIDGYNYGMVLDNNQAAYDLFSVLPLQLTMNDLNNNEKYAYLSFSLYEEGNYTGKISKGDVMLYQSNCIVIFYEDTETELYYTKLGHIDNLNDLGNGSINVIFN